MAKVIDKNKEIKNIVVGVSFGVKRETFTTWQPGRVDFIFRIIDRTKWDIGIFKQSMRDLISQIEGDTNFPDVYVCDLDNYDALFG